METDIYHRAFAKHDEEKVPELRNMRDGDAQQGLYRTMGLGLWIM